MAAGSPIPLGSAASSNVLIPDSRSKIATDDFGIQRGTIRFQLGNQSFAQNLRPAKGSPYTGDLPQFRGFLVDYPGDIQGEEGQAAYVDVTYAKLDPRFVMEPQLGHDLEYRDAGFLTDFGSGGLFLQQPQIPIPHPLVSVKFSDTKAQNKLGKTETPAFLPKIDRYVYPVNVVTGATIQNTKDSLEIVSLNVQTAIKMIFIPKPDGWLCVKDDNVPVCGGKFFQVEQQWKMFYIFAGFEK